MEPGRRRHRVLLILEQPEDREVANEVLRAKYEIHSRESPIGATVEIVRSEIDVVIVDVDFAVMSGDRFAELIRRNDRLDHIGLLLVTSSGAMAAQQMAKDVGADGGLTRAALRPNLPAAVERALVRCRRRGSNPPPAGTTTILMLRTDRFAMPLVDGRQLIGRDAACRFVLNHASVSRQHAALEVRGVRARVEDLGSSNGTFVNGRQISRPTDLDVGDVIRIGEEELTLGVKTQLTRETMELD